MTSKSSFEETATYWTQIYAGGPGRNNKLNGDTRDEIAIAGLEQAHVERFESLGFQRTKVIDVLRRLNYRGTNVAKLTEERVVEELLK
jgi:ubiquitin-conjugating enzyme (huntingtin interacting protein 2)